MANGKKSVKKTGIILLLISTIVSAFAHYFLKIFTNSFNIVLLGISLLFYFTSILLVVKGLSYGELSKLHPLLFLKFIWAVLLAVIFLGEQLLFFDILGMIILFSGLVMIAK